MQSRVPQLDGLRGIAILLVVAWHYVGAPMGSHGGSAANGTLARGPLTLAWCGVDLFFVLSGFLIADILLRARLASNYYTVFYFRRACRLLPLYGITLLSFLVARLLLIDNEILGPMFAPNRPPLWTYMALVQNIGMASSDSFGAGWLAVTWSLAVEWQFYLVFPLLVRYTGPRNLPWVAFGVLLAGPVVRMLLPPVAGYVSLVSRVDTFMAGVLVAHFLSQSQLRQMVNSKLTQLHIMWWVLSAGLVGMSLRAEAFGAVTTWYGTFTHTLLAVYFALTVLLLLADQSWWLLRVLCLKPLRLVGVVSYGFYLTHQPVNWLLHAGLRQQQPQLSDATDIGITLLSAGLSLALASAAYFTFEQWFIALGRVKKYRNPMSSESTWTKTPLPDELDRQLNGNHQTLPSQAV